MSACIYLESLESDPLPPRISPSCLPGLERKGSGYLCHSMAASPLVLVSATYMTCKVPKPRASLSHTLPASCHLKAIMNQVLNQMFCNTISVPHIALSPFSFYYHPSSSMPHFLIHLVTRMMVLNKIHILKCFGIY